MKEIPIHVNKNHFAIKSYAKAVKKGQEAQHVVPRDGKWAVKRGGASKPSKICDTQREAESHAKRIAMKNKSSFYVHKRNGLIRKGRDFS